MVKATGAEEMAMVRGRGRGLWRLCLAICEEDVNRKVMMLLMDGLDFVLSFSLSGTEA
jgi:hypothetical protein